MAKNFVLCITLFVHFFAVLGTTATWNFLISPARFMEYVNKTQKLSFSFSKLRYGPFEFSPRKFHQYLTHQRVTKFETVGVHILSDVFGLLSSRNFATMATWRNDFSSLFYKGFLWNRIFQNDLSIIWCWNKAISNIVQVQFILVNADDHTMIQYQLSCESRLLANMPQF